ncbi:Transcription factor MYB115, partial [Hondaea fermentalgiana]
GPEALEERREERRGAPRTRDMANESELGGLGSKRPLSDLDNLSDDESESRKTARKDDEEIIKGAWSPEEDEIVKKAVEKVGTDWKAVAAMIKGRTSKQCRDRYKLKLDPNINHGPWTPEEDKELMQLHSQLGRQWTKIAKLMEGRTENSVKSRFASLDRSRKREWTDEEDLILRRCRDNNLDYAEIAQIHLPKRSEHAIKKRWERLFMRDLAKKIRDELPGTSSNDMSLHGAAAAGLSLSQNAVGPGGHAHYGAESAGLSTAAAAAHSMGLQTHQPYPSQQHMPAPQRPLAPPMYQGGGSSVGHEQPLSLGHSPHMHHHQQQQQQQQQRYDTLPSGPSSSTVSATSMQPPPLLLKPESSHPGDSHRRVSDGVGEVLGTLVDEGENANFHVLRKRLTAESNGPSTSSSSSSSSSSTMLAPAPRTEHPFQFLSSNPPETSAQQESNESDTNASRKSRSGNLKRQTTSVTILRQILPDPLP